MDQTPQHECQENLGWRPTVGELKNERQAGTDEVTQNLMLYLPDVPGAPFAPVSMWFSPFPVVSGPDHDGKYCAGAVTSRINTFEVWLDNLRRVKCFELSKQELFTLYFSQILKDYERRVHTIQVSVLDWLRRVVCYDSDEEWDPPAPGHEDPLMFADDITMFTTQSAQLRAEVISSRTFTEWRVKLYPHMLEGLPACRGANSTRTARVL